MTYRYLLGLFDDEVPTLQAVKKLRERGYKIHDVLSPFPIHGLDPALGIKETRLHTMGFIFGATGLSFGLLAMSYITSFDWPNNFGGKPNFPLPAFIPITFEMTVLFTAVGMVIVYYLRNKLSIFRNPEILEPRTTDDRFAIVFDLQKYGSDADGIADVLRNLGAVEVKVREMHEKQPSHDEQSA
ncbi:MAG: DUF3341 domain-containing protein [Sphingobacteriales bacterium]|nr:DUF3341 domain-containing protein [Sphingobacteriales bacterium]